MERTLYLVVKGGLLQEVISNDNTIDVILVDYDCMDKELAKEAEDKLNNLHDDFQNLHITSF